MRVPLRAKGGQAGSDHDGRDILGLQSCFLVARVHAQPLQHPDQGLAGEDRGIEPVTRAVQPDDQPVADELIFPDALDIGDVLDAHLAQTGRRN
jgi:hypothetical protein